MTGVVRTDFAGTGRKNAAWRYADNSDRPSLPEVNSTISVPIGGTWLRRLLAFAGPEEFESAVSGKKTEKGAPKK